MSPELLERLRTEVALWSQEQQNPSDAYSFEKTFVEMWNRLGHEVLQDHFGKLPKSRNLKKRSRQPSDGSTAPSSIF